MMKDKMIINARGLGYDYYNHKIFTMLSDLEFFYYFLSNSSFGNVDGLFLTQKISYQNKIYASIQGSIESIKILVYIGRLNDAFALVRKYYDAVTTDIYQSILTKEEEKDCLDCGASKNSVISAWTYAQEHLYDMPSKKNKPPRTYEDKNRALKKLDNDLFIITSDIKKKQSKDICNDNMHYNSWDNYVLNVNESFDSTNKINALNEMFENISMVICYHFSYIYRLHPEYYSSSDYRDALDMGISPETDSQYWVAPIVQDVFDKYIKTYSKQLTTYILNLKSLNFQ